MELQGDYRHELKYQINYAQYLAIRQRIRSLMKLDQHATKDGQYFIRSIYFDNTDDKALREKVNGVQKREKFRIRYYNDDFSHIKLEKKMKHNNLCLKFANKHIIKIVAVIMAIAVCLCLCAMVYSKEIENALGGSKISMEYESKLFDTSEIISINILMDEEQWSQMLSNAMQEEYYSCDVVINEETFYNIGIRPKGNTSLSSIANDPDNDRYSLKLEFDQYVDGQTCYGLEERCQKDLIHLNLEGKCQKE